MNSDLIPPNGAKHFLKGAWHKVGADNKIYIHTGEQWISSTKTMQQYNREILRVKRELELCQNY
tara:strand:- start:1561 stop:1752 length:192 start_codon:yes stop_codon:yes gene_type:complete